MAQLLSLQRLLQVVNLVRASHPRFDGRHGCHHDYATLSRVQVEACDLAQTPDDIYEAVCSCNATLLSKGQAGSCALIKRILELIQDTSLEPKQGCRIPEVVDQQGQRVGRHTLLQRERTVLCEASRYKSRHTGTRMYGSQP